MTTPTYGPSLVPPADIVARIDELIPRDEITEVPLVWRKGSFDARVLIRARNEILCLRARVAVLEQLTRESLDILTCAGHDTGHYCVQCGIVDYKWPHRSELRAALETKP